MSGFRMRWRAACSGRAGLASACLASVVAASGCGLGPALVGIEPAPAQVTTAAPITPESAQRIATRVLRDAEAARAATGSEAKALRSAALTGIALTVANADSRLPAPTGAPTAEPLSTGADAKVLAVSRGSSWPRLILAQTTTEGGTPVLNLLSSPDAATPFRLAVRAPMQPGAKVAALDDLADGSPVRTDGRGLAADPGQLLQAYAASLAYPRARPTSAFTAEDPFAVSVRRNAAAQARRLGTLATLTQSHRVLPEHTTALSLKDGGALVFALLRRDDTIRLAKAGKSLTPSAQFQALTRKKTLTRRADLRTFETVVLTVPPSGDATVVAVDETLVAASGS